MTPPERAARNAIADAHDWALWLLKWRTQYDLTPTVIAHLEMIVRSHRGLTRCRRAQNAAETKKGKR